MGHYLRVPFAKRGLNLDGRILAGEQGKHSLVSHGFHCCCVRIVRRVDKLHVVGYIRIHVARQVYLQLKAGNGLVQHLFGRLSAGKHAYAFAVHHYCRGNVLRIGRGGCGGDNRANVGRGLGRWDSRWGWRGCSGWGGGRLRIRVDFGRTHYARRRNAYRHRRRRAKAYPFGRVVLLPHPGNVFFVKIMHVLFHIKHYTAKKVPRRVKIS